MPLVNFLNAVLPKEGVKCWVGISQNGVAQGFCPTTEKLAAKLLEISARGDDAYFACATYKTATTRRAANADRIKAFWQDIDCGVGKPYATQDDGLRALDEFCARCSIDIPGVVRSGYGLHAYWVLDRELTGDEWRPVAERLKLLCTQHGFAADPARTADAASILRPPGTKNYKDPLNPRDVEVDDFELFKEINYEDFYSALFSVSGTHSPRRAVVESPKKYTSALAAGLNTGFDVDAVVNEGGRNDALHKAVWHFLGKGFSVEDTWRMAIDYGRLKCVPALPEDEIQRCTEKSIRGWLEKQPAPAVAVPDDLPKLPRSFRWAGGALFFDAQEEDDSGKEITIPHCLSDRPVYLKALSGVEGEFRQENACVMMTRHPTKGMQEFTLSMEQVYSNDWRAEVSKRGVTINSGKDKFFKTFMIESERMARTMPEVIQYNQMGWKDNYTSFLVGSDLIKPDGTIVKAASTPKMQQFANFMRPRGTFDGWQAPATKFTMAGGEPWLACLVSSFASVLIPFCLDEGNGGCVLSVRTEESGFGKTPTVQAVSSVWGEMSACRVTGTYTWNRSQTELVHRKHITQVEEEMPMADGMIVAKHIKDFTSGTSKGRLNSRGEIVGEPEYFQTIMMVMSNMSLYDIVKQHDEPMSRRIFQICPERPPEALLSNLGAITREMGRNCGHAARRVLSYLVQPAVMECALYELRGKSLENLGATQYRYRSLLASEAPDRYIIALLAANDFMSTILNKSGVLEFEPARLMEYFVAQAKLITVGGELAGQGGMPKYVGYLSRFLTDHSNCQITVMAAHRHGMEQIPKRLPTGQPVIRKEEAPHTMYITTHAIKSWATKNKINVDEMYSALKLLGIVRGSKYYTIGAGTDITTGQAWCWELDTAHAMMTVAEKPALSGEKVEKLRK